MIAEITNLSILKDEFHECNSNTTSCLDEIEEFLESNKSISYSCFQAGKKLLEESDSLYENLCELYQKYQSQLDIILTFLDNKSFQINLYKEQANNIHTSFDQTFNEYVKTRTKLEKALYPEQILI